MRTFFVRYRRARLAGALVLCSLLLAACGGGGDGDGDTTGNAVLDERGALLTQVAIRVEARGPHCVNGGTRVEGGVDADGDGRLSAAETSSVGGESLFAAKSVSSSRACPSPSIPSSTTTS